MIPSAMELDGFIEQFFSAESEKWLGGVMQMKNIVIGNNKQKSSMIAFGVVPRLLQFLLDEGVPPQLKLESAVVLGSLAKGTRDNIQALVDAGAISVLLREMNHPNMKYVEACLRCLRTIFMSSVAPIDYIYQDPGCVPHMISIMCQSVCLQECVTSILANCCKNMEQQVILCSSGIISALALFIASEIYAIQMPALRCFSVLCFQNQQVSMAVATAMHNGRPVPHLLASCLARDKTTDTQMQAAKCLTYLSRAGAIEPSDQLVSHKTLPALIRLCKQDKTWEERVEAAESLAYLIEVDVTLQRTTAISDHILDTLAEYFRYPGCPLDATLMPTKKDDIVVGNELRQSAFKAYASLGANDEDIRKRIIETEHLMEHVVNGLSDPVTKVQLSAVRCLHSLSRSVQQLRTSFQDHAVWKPLMKILHSASDEVLVVASSTLCNLLLEFSPSKEPMLELGAIDLLVTLTKKEDPALRLNGIWALMNLAFQATQKIRSQILSGLGTDQLFRLLCDRDVNVLLKTLGLLRNLLSSKPHIDQMMTIHGTQIMQAVILILEGDHPVEVKEQALCILANVADGDTAKDFIMMNEDVLKKIMNYMIHSDVRLQIAATFCISNLVWNEEEGAMDRQSKLRELGAQKLLQQLLSTSDTVLFDKVKIALQQF